MLNGWVISDKKQGDGYLTGDDLKKLGSIPLKLEFINLHDIALEIDSDKTDEMYVAGAYRPLPDFALCIFETEVGFLHFGLLRQLEMLGVFCLHKAENIDGSLNKLHSYQKLLKAGIPVAKTVVLNSNTDLGWLVERLGLPMVLKVPDGSKGEGVCLVHSAAELKNITELYCGTSQKNLLAQEFVATSRGRDVRITLCDDELVFGVLRDNSKGDDFRSNISVGGDGIYWEPDPQALELAKDVMRVMNMKLCGVDLLFGKHGYIVGEINSMPGCLHITHAGKTNLERLLVAIYKAVVKNTRHEA